MIDFTNFTPSQRKALDHLSSGKEITLITFLNVTQDKSLFVEIKAKTDYTVSGVMEYTRAIGRRGGIIVVG